jgi:ribulose kinase
MAHIEHYYIGVDVGTSSVRALIVDPDGTIVASSIQPIDTYRDPADHHVFEQSTTNIWSAISTAIKSTLAQAEVDGNMIKGLGFDAACSLAVVNWEDQPIVVTKGAQLGSVGERNIIVWCDHRAEEEAELINKSDSVVLDYVGGTMGVRYPFPC